MKRFLGILSCVIAFTACDDGDFIVDTIDFDEVAASSCTENNLLFKLKDAESLILNIPAATFQEDATAKDKPIQLNINSTNQVVYNFYDGKASTANICALLKPPTPGIKSQWNAASGVVEITSVTIKSSNETDNSTKITGYKNTIVFKNITFAKGDGTTQFYETFSFGDYLQTITPLALNFDKILGVCDKTTAATRFVYNNNASESLTLAIDSNLLKNEITPVGKPRTGTIGLVVNRLVYHSYLLGVVPDDYFCKTPVPESPAIDEIWIGVEGGTIEVTTETSGPNVYKHTIVLKNATLKKGNSDFQLGNNYNYGALTVQQ